MENQALKKHYCYICDAILSYSFSAEDYISNEKFDIYRCLKCNLAITKPDLRSDDFDKYYSSLYYGRRKSFSDRLINNSRLRKIKRISESFEKKVAERSLLDIGCGDGGFISLLASKGWRVFGTEIASENSHINAAPDYICRKEITDCKLADADFSIVTMWHSLEHFVEPLKYLKEVARILKPDGILLLEVPNFNSWQSKIFKNNWFHLDVPRHVFHYDKKSLELILKKADFKILKISYNSLIYGLFGWIQSCLNFFCRRKNLLFDLLNRKLGLADLKNHSVGARDFILTFVLVIPVSLFSLLFFIPEVVFKRGGIIIVWARPNNI